MTDRYTAHEHVFVLAQSQASCHIVNSYVCSVEFCGSAKNEWPETGEYVSVIREDSGRQVLVSRVWRHWGSLLDAVEFLERLTTIVRERGLPDDLPGESTFVGKHPPKPGTLN